MATINQALDILKKACGNFSVREEINTDYFRGESVITIVIPYGTPLDEEIEGTNTMVDVHTARICKNAINAVYGVSSCAERITETLDKKTKSLKDFENRFFGTYKIPEVREIRYNGPATIVFWEDNTKTVVKVQPGEKHYDPDKAFAMAVCKKLFGNKFNRYLTKAQKAYEKSCEDEYNKQVKEFINNPADYIYNVLDSFDKFWGRYHNPSVNDFKPKKEE